MATTVKMVVLADSGVFGKKWWSGLVVFFTPFHAWPT